MAPPTQNNDDWLASLAHKAVSSDATTNAVGSKKVGKRKKGVATRKGSDTSPSSSSKPSSSTSDAPPSNLLSTKAERIKHREQKKQQRDERKRKAEEIRQLRLAKKRQKLGDGKSG
jgi:hypothetical protein